jgi:putative tricarboxylic transport membrane protein
LNRDQFVGLCCLMIGLLISVRSVRLGVGSFPLPQAGLFPFLIGLAILLLAAILFTGGKQKKELPILGVLWKNILFVLGSVSFYAFALDRLGFPITTVIFMIFSLKAIEPQKWSVALIIAVLSTLFAYSVFSLWLKIEFPKGIFGW